MHRYSACSALLLCHSNNIDLLYFICCTSSPNLVVVTCPHISCSASSVPKSYAYAYIVLWQIQRSFMVGWGVVVRGDDDDDDDDDERMNINVA